MTQTTSDAKATPAHPHPEQQSHGFRATNAPRGTALRHPWVELGLLAAGLIVTVLASIHIKAGVESAAQRELEFTCNETRLRIEARLDAAAQILRSGAGLFDASETVSRKEWQAFTQRMDVEKNLPGIQGVGFALLIPREQLARHVQEIRRQGFPDYQVRPAGERETYSAVIYLEPFSDRNLRAFGYDMLSEPVRRAAMERARDENTVALSGKVVLMQETHQEVQAGALMYIPVYRHGVPIETIEQRRTAIQGWVYSPYRMTDLMRGTLGNWDVKHYGDKRIVLQLYDGDVVSADTLLYDSRGAEAKALTSIAGVVRLTPVNFAGHHWTLRFILPGGLASSADYSSAWLVLFGGTTINVLLFGLMLWRRQRVRFYKERAVVAEALRASELRYRRLFESAKDGILILDAETGMVVDVNPFLVRLLGFSHEQFLGKAVWDLGFFKDILANQAKFLELQQKEYVRYADLPLETADGRKINVEFVSNVYEVDSKPVIQCNIRDITERRKTEMALRETEELFRLAAETSTDVIYEWDLRQRLVWHGRINELLGYAPGEFPGTLDAWADSIHPEDIKRVMAALKAHLEQRAPYAQEYRIRQKDGTYRWWAAHGIAARAPNGDPVRLIGTVTDITERKRAESELAEQLDELRRWHEVTVGRETRVLELKREVNELLARAGKPARYTSVEPDSSDGGAPTGTPGDGTAGGDKVKART